MTTSKIEELEERISFLEKSLDKLLDILTKINNSNLKVDVALKSLGSEQDEIKGKLNKIIDHIRPDGDFYGFSMKEQDYLRGINNESKRTY